MKIDTSELISLALDWAVAKASHNLYPVGDVRLLDGKLFTIEPGDSDRSDAWRTSSPSTDWSQGGPIIEREQVELRYSEDKWYAQPKDMDSICQRKSGLSPLVAAMRCYVASKLGYTVEIPNELLTNSEERPSITPS